KCKAVGMNDYIAKPVDERILYNKIVGLVKKPLFVENVEEKESEIKLGKKIKCTDLAYLIHRTKCDSTLMMEMILLYLEQTPPLINAMKQSLKDKDWKMLHSAVHKMIPSFIIMGINPDFEVMARKVKDFADTQQQSDGIFEMVQQLENVCLQACRELEEEYNTIKNTNS
ncbi:MAG: hybrid sensor histidine kinase/response regulator, partial [Bacteroidota bacterium]